MSPQRSDIPDFFLYGEPARQVELRFLHVETLEVRSRANDWTIRPHIHRDLHQFMLITAGRGTLSAATETVSFEAPCLLVVPAGAVHGFRFVPETEGHVAMAAVSLVSDLARDDPDIARLLRGTACLAMRSGHVHGLPDAFEALAREFVWSGPARMPAIEAQLLRILVGAARLTVEAGSRSAPRLGADAALVARFRQTIERQFRSGWALDDYARALGVSASRLAGACRQAGEEPAMRLVHRRLVLEAQRQLLYTTKPVAEIAFSLGFRDPAYFSRFFARHAHKPPVAFRARHRPEDG